MEIIKSFRKTLTMKIDKTGKLIVKAPFFTSKKTIEDFINKNKNWIDERKNDLLDKIREFKEWEKYFFFWDQYELIFDNKNDKIFFDWMNFYLNKKHKNIIKEKLTDFYKYEAKKFITKRINEIAEINWLKFNGLKITSARTRWGSCTSKKNINFSYRLIMAPIKTIDYVIIHELAHLKEMNHSKKFRDLVSDFSLKLYPWNFKIHRKWLKDNGNKLMYT